MKSNTISAYESGKVEIPHSKLQLIAKAFDIKTTDLLPIEESSGQDTISDYIQEAKSKLTNNQLVFLEQLIGKTLSIDENERERLFDYIRLAVEFYDKK